MLRWRILNLLNYTIWEKLDFILKHLRSKAEIIVSKKSFLVYLLKIQNKNLLKSWDFLKTELKNNIGLMFTQIDPLIINRILKSYFIKSFALSGDIAQKDIKIKKGNKKISPSQTPFFQVIIISRGFRNTYKSV